MTWLALVNIPIERLGLGISLILEQIVDTAIVA
jgi:hypothetical protein